MKNTRTILRGISLLVSMMTLISSLRAQPLKPGDKMPDMEFDQLFNYGSGKLKLSDFKGKSLILDFWGTRCIGCLLSFPRMDSLQKSFGDKIQIIMVGHESRELISKFFSARKKIKVPDVPFITSDKVLNARFPHIGNPFHVWIDDKGIIRYTADNYNATSQNISYFLEGRDPGILNRKDNIYIQTLVDKQWKDMFLCYSYLTRGRLDVHLEGLEVPDGVKEITCARRTAPELYQYAYEWLTNKKYSFTRPGRTILELKDPYQYIRPRAAREFADWGEKYSYNYQLWVPAARKDRIYEFMLADLEKYFDLKADIEKRSIKCWTLMRTSDKDKLHSKGGTPLDEFWRSKLRETIYRSLRGIYNQPFSTFSFRLRIYIESMLLVPFMDSTGYEGNIDIEMKGETLDALSINGLRQELKKYDLDLVEKEWPLDVLVIKDK